MLSLSGKYALKILIELAKKPHGRYYSVPEISERIDDVAPYYAKIIKELAKKKLVETRKGPGGGVRIAECGRNASFYDVCEAFHEGVVRDSCFLSRLPCNSRNPCPIHPMWAKARADMLDFLKSHRISDAVPVKRKRHF